MSIGMRIVFFVAIILMHIFIYFVLFKNISTSPIIKHIGKCIVVANFVCIILFFKLYHTHTNAMLYTFLSSSLGIFWISFNVALITFVLTLCIRLGFGAFSLYKLESIIIIIAWFAIAFLTCLSFYLNTKKPNVVEEKIIINNLKQPLQIALFTDMHIDVLMNQKQVAQIVDQTNALNPDIIVMVGDIIDNYYSIVQDSVRELGRLKAKYGVYYVLGNHEYYYDTYTILKELHDLGITTLVNQNVTLYNIGINIAGIADLAGQMRSFKDSILTPNLVATLTNANNKLPTILLSHQPKIINYFNGEHIDLVLSGHTHGGQIFPFHLLVLFDQPFLYGLHSFIHNNKTSQIFISQGVGWWGMPMRLFGRREINMLHLMPNSENIF